MYLECVRFVGFGHAVALMGEEKRRGREDSWHKQIDRTYVLSLSRIMISICIAVWRQSVHSMSVLQVASLPFKRRAQHQHMNHMAAHTCWTDSKRIAQRCRASHTCTCTSPHDTDIHMRVLLCWMRSASFLPNRCQLFCRTRAHMTCICISSTTCSSVDVLLRIIRCTTRGCWCETCHHIG